LGGPPKNPQEKKQPESPLLWPAGNGRRRTRRNYWDGKNVEAPSGKGKSAPTGKRQTVEIFFEGKKSTLLNGTKAATSKGGREMVALLKK